MKTRLLLILLSFLIPLTAFSQKKYTLKSPNGKLKAELTLGDQIKYKIFHEQDILLEDSPISMELDQNTFFGLKPKVRRTHQKSVNEVINASVYKKRKIDNTYNELTIDFKGNYSVIFRAFDDGIAYRFTTSLKRPYKVINEQVELNLPNNLYAYIPYVNRSITEIDKQFFNSFENIYVHKKIAEWNPKRLAFTPLLVEASNNKKVVFMEADLLNYPGMYLHNGEQSTTLKGVFAKHPKVVKQGGHNMLQGMVESREDFIASFNGPAEFPWRVTVVAKEDKDLTNNDMVYKLATPSKGNFEWVKPGKVAWEWWNDWNLYGVDFKSGINNETYKYYIDFASNHGIEYIILDEGWAVNKQADLYQVVENIDLKELIQYGNERNVGLILWAGYYAINKDKEGICKHYSEMGIKGFKVDFMDRDDQPMVSFHKELAEIAAKHHLLIDYHGTYKPTGLQRTFPNVINFEGVYGLEQLKWGKEDLVTYDVTMPFIRMVSGPVDYTQGTMRNATKGNFRPVNSEAMSQGTRCRQLAQYIVFESPLNMMCDSPSNYIKEKECTEFITNIPTTWDETVAINGEISKYVSIARRKGAEWYVGGITNWSKRELTLNLDFLGQGSYKAELFRDGINADRAARDYKKEIIDIPHTRELSISLAPGGGFAMRIYRDN